MKYTVRQKAAAQKDLKKWLRIWDAESTQDVWDILCEPCNICDLSEKCSVCPIQTACHAHHFRITAWADRTSHRSRAETRIHIAAIIIVLLRITLT